MIEKLFLRAVLGVLPIICVACGAISRGTKVAEHPPQPPLQYCELANHPEKYDGQKVRVVATLYFGMHGFKFMDKDCLGDEKETAVLLDAADDASLASATGSDEYDPWSSPRIITTGKFSRVTPSRKSDSSADNLVMIFEMEDVESIVR